MQFCHLGWAQQAAHSLGGSCTHRPGGWGEPGPAPTGSPAGPQQGPCGSKPPTFLTLQGSFRWVRWLRVGCLAAGAADSWGQPQSPPCGLQAEFPRWLVGSLSTLVTVDQDLGGPGPGGLCSCGQTIPVDGTFESPGPSAASWLNCLILSHFL